MVLALHQKGCMRNSVASVHVGKEGWLFLDGGSNDFMSYLRGEKKLSLEICERWQKILLNRKTWFDKSGIKYVHVFAPEKTTMYPEYILGNVNPAFGHISVLARMDPSLFLNPIPYFSAIKNQYRLYDKTDTHWNRTGAIACYQLLCSVLKYQPRTDLALGMRRKVNALLDLGSKLRPHQREQVELITRDAGARRVFANILVRHKEKWKIENEAGLHVGSRVVFRNDDALYAGKIIIFGDSFAEYRPGRLTEMFAETFSEVHFCWSANIDYAYVQAVRADVVITEMSERFAVLPPDDLFKVDHFARLRFRDHYRTRGSLEGQGVAPAPFSEGASLPKPKRHSPLPVTGLRGPDYLIVGSMKCGTTILNDYINEHPQVHPAKQKEIHYFSLCYDKGEEWYASFFEEAPNDKITGEASPTYFDLTNGHPLPQLIRTTLPDVKVVAVIKDPVDRALSHFFHLRNVNKAPVFQTLDPSEVFSGDLFRKYHEEFLVNPDLRLMRYVLDFGNYFLRVQTYKQIFGDSLMVLNGKDLWNDGQAVMDQVFEHLGLPAFRSAMFERKAYVTSNSLKQIELEAIRSLEEYYKGDMEMLRRHFGLSLR